MVAQPPSQHSSIPPFLSGEGERAALATLVQKIARNAVELLNLDDCAVALLDETGAHLAFLAASQDVVGDVQSTFPLNQEPLATLVLRREALVLRDVYLDARLQALAGQSTRALACLPLFEREQLLGVLLASSSAPGAFAPAHLRSLTLLAEQTALALSNACQAEQVRDARRMKANFLSLITHELRSPLNTINGYLDLILEGIAGEVNEQQLEFIRRARASSEHLYALLEDLLLASRADSGRLSLQRAPTSLKELISAAIDELEMSALDNQVALEAELPAGLPILHVDSVRLQQVLRNLLINALRFTPAGGRVIVSARALSDQPAQPAELIEVSVRDTGIGIAPEYHTQIFERFFQVPRAEGGRASGQGLGLAIVKMIVELHGGQVRVESAPGQGSAFLFILPAAKGD